MASVPVGVGDLRLIIETSSGLLVRDVRAATPLDTSATQGRAAEGAAMSAAASLGLPDFVFSADLVSLGSGTRELGDVLLIVGSRRLVVQGKSRFSPGSVPSREVSWVHKSITKAARQAAGTVRSLCNRPAALTNLRGRQATIDGTTIAWAAVVILDHESAPTEVVPLDFPKEGLPTLVLLRRDWEFLFEQLGSAAAVLGCVFRTSSMPPVALGQEPVRYYELAQADESAPPTNPYWQSNLLGAQILSTPLLPLLPAGHEDRNAQLLLRMIQEDIATVPIGDLNETRRTVLLTELDSLPVGQRTELGQHLLGMLDEVALTGTEEVRWAVRRIFSGPEAPHLIFAVCSRYDEATSWAFGQLVQLRHYELGKAMKLENLTSVGVLLTPREDGIAPWDTTAVRLTGSVKIPKAELRQSLDLWGRQQDHDGDQVWSPSR